MKTTCKTFPGGTVVIARPDVRLQGVRDALDLIANVRTEHGDDVCGVILDAGSLDPQFFALRTGLAGEMLQKFITYQMKLAIVCDLGTNTSRSLADFVRESNRGKDIFFVPTEEEALARLGALLT